MPLASDILGSLEASITTQTLTSCSRWAQERRVMGGDFPGKYSFKYHPWAKEPHDSRAPFNVSMKSAQMGFTEIGINRAFYILDVLKRDVLYVLPTMLNAGDFSRSRFGPALQYSDYINDMFTNTNTVNLKQAGPATLYIRGSRGDSNLKSIPVSELILDEVDEMGPRTIWLAFERLSGQLRQNIWAISTPKLPEQGIHSLYQTTTQEHFFFKCPRCGRHTELIWPDSFVVVGETLEDPKLEESYLICKECKKPLKHEEKPDFLAKAEWIVTNKKANKEQRGFWINQLYSYTVKPGAVAKAYMRGVGDEGAMAEFHNSKMGLPYIPEGGRLTDEILDSCLGTHTRDDLRPKTGSGRLITMGVDQGNFLHVEVDEWFFTEMGPDLNLLAVCKCLWQGTINVEAEGNWERLYQLMREWQVLHCVIDADPNTLEARRFARKFPKFVSLCRFRKGVTQRELKNDEDNDGMTIADRTNWMDCAFGRFRVDGRMILPRDTLLEYRSNLKAPIRTYVKDENNNPRAVYVNSKPDHFALARVYSEIALPLGCSFQTGRDVSKFL